MLLEPDSEYHFKEPKKYIPPEPLPPRAEDLFPRQDNYLAGRDLDYKIARANYWYPTLYSGHPRIVIPCTGGFWQARLMEGGEPRYLSSKGSRGGAYCVVWPVDIANPVLSITTIICEGPMDALAAAGLGATGVATLGVNFGSYILDWLAYKKHDTIFIIPDLDNAEFGYDMLAMLTSRGMSATVKIPDKKDFASMTVKQRVKLIDKTT